LLAGAMKLLAVRFNPSAHLLPWIFHRIQF